MSTQPGVGRIVHYVARGSLDGVFPPACRAAVVTEAGGWVADSAEFAVDCECGKGGRHRVVHETWRPDAVHLQVLNPTGTFVHGPMTYDGGSMAPSERADGLGAGPSTDLCDGQEHAGGTWHWPVRT